MDDRRQRDGHQAAREEQVGAAVADDDLGAVAVEQRALLGPGQRIARTRGLEPEAHARVEDQVERDRVAGRPRAPVVVAPVVAGAGQGREAVAARAALDDERGLGRIDARGEHPTSIDAEK